MLREPAAELSLRPDGPGESLGQEVVVQPDNQIRCNRSSERRWIKMGQRPGMEWLTSAVHDDLKSFNSATSPLITRNQLRLGTDHRQWWTFRSRADPLAEQIACLMQKVAQNRIRVLRRGEW